MEFHAKPVLDLFRNRKTEAYLLQQYCVSKSDGFTLATGDFVVAQDVTLVALLGYLGRFRACESRDKSGLERLPSKDRAKFKRDHVWIVICRQDRSTVTLQLMQWSGGGGVGSPEDRVTLRLPAADAAFRQKLTELLEKAK